MNTIRKIVLILALSLAGTHAQTVNTAGSQSAADASSGAYSAVIQDGSSCVWSKTTYQLDSSGVATAKEHSYIQLETGMNHMVSGNWVPSSEQIDILSDGSAEATNGQHQVFFPGDINQGVIAIVTPNSQMLSSRPLLLVYTDGTNIETIGQITNSAGELIATNQVIYPDAFDGIKADVVYTYTKGGIEQDIIIRQQMPSPESLGFDPTITRIELMTEFFDPPQPELSDGIIDPVHQIQDTEIGLGGMRMELGKAFSTRDAQGKSVDGATVFKDWVVVSGRTFLVERLPYESIAQQLETLPLHASITKPAGPLKMAMIKPAATFLPPPASPIVNSTRPILLAKADNKDPGFVLDYVLLNSTVGDFTFQADTTYFMNGSSYFEIDGVATFEGGTVIKFSPTSGGFQLSWGGISCQSSPYRPIIMTAQDDNTVGETISGSSGVPSGYYGNGINIFSHGNITLHDIRMSYLNYGFDMNANYSEFDNIQAINCSTPIIHAWAGATVNNGLFYNIGNIALACSGTGTAVSGTQLTIDNCNTFADSSTLSLTLANSLVTATTNLLAGAGTLTTNKVTVLTSNSGIYKTVGAGSHYLASNTYRAAGTNNISASVLASLTSRTTYPPLVLSNLTYSISTNLLQQATRDTNASPDLGYHYDPLDYITDGLIVTNAALAISNGIAIACYNEPGILLRDGASIISVGTPTSPNWLVRYQSAQDLSVYLGGTNSSSAQNISAAPWGASLPTGLFQFTHFAAPANGGWHFSHQSTNSFASLTMQHNELWGGTNSFSGPSGAANASLLNNLFFRSSIGATNSSASATLTFTNNMMYGATISLGQPSGGSWYFFNNEVDSCTIATNSSITNGFNAFINCSFNFTGTSNIISTNAIGYQSGWLGSFYQPTNSLLINAGSVAANQLGLQHFTTQTNQTTESNSVVDIGYHYVAVDTNGIPLKDTNGVPFYIEDGNVNQGPAITVQPANIAAIVGSNATFSVTATGTATLKYQWWFNATNLLAGATSASLTLTNVQTTNAGNYSVVVTNSYGSVTSSAAALTVIVPVTITVQPTNLTVFQGSNATFSVTATGTAPLSYQWWFNSTNLLAWATGASMTLTNVQLTNAGNYSVVVTNAGSSATSSNALLTVLIQNCYSSPSGLIYWWAAEGDANDRVGGNTGTLQGGTTFTNGMVGQAFAFNGTNGFVGTTIVQTNPQNVTLELWFKTSTSSGGVLMELGDSQLGTSGNYDRNLYMDNTGKLHFGTWTTSAMMANSASSYNDGSWHHVAATLSSTVGSCLYMDGALVATNASATPAANYNGWWRIGDNNLTGWPSAPSSFYFNGFIDEVSVYNRALTSSEVAAIYGANWLGKCPLSTPSISITNPVNNALFIASQTNIALGASVSNLTGTTWVQFMQGTTSLGFVTNSPFTLIWSNAAAGNYALSAVVFDNYGNSITSSVVNITVTPLFATNTASLWLKANAITGLTNSALVSTWPDSSGWGKDATQSTAAKQPLYFTNVINGFPAVWFNGANNFATGSNSVLNLPTFMAGATQGEALVVLQANTNNPGNPQPLWYLGTYNYTIGGYPEPDGSVQDGFGSANLYNIGVPAQNLMQFHVYDVESKTNYWSAWVNAILQYQTTNNTVGFPSGSTTLGGSDYFFGGSIAEVVVFRRALTTSERAIVNTYLNAKYALVSPVPPTPTNLTATAISPTQIGLTWNEPLTNCGATQVSVERSTNNSVFSPVAQVGNTLSYVDTNLAAGTLYYYRVRAVNLAQWSSYSSIASATTLTNGNDLPLSALTLWLKADSGLFQANTNVIVSYWADQSGKGNDASQISPAKLPVWIPNALGGHPAIRFNGANNFATGSNSVLNLPAFMTGATQGEALVVLQANTNNPGNPQPLWYLGTYNKTTGGYPEPGGGIQEGFGSANLYNLGTPTQALTQFHVYEVESQTSDWSAWINGILQYQTTNNSVGFPNSPTTLGGSSYFFGGSIAEVMVFNRVLNVDEKAAVGNYLFQKYSLSQYATNTSIPAAPTNLLATGLAPSRLNLSWNSKSTNQTGYILERKLSGGSYAEIATLSGSLTNFVDTTATPSNQYFYRVKTENYFGQSGYLAEISPPTINITNCPTTALESETNLIAAAATDAYGSVSSVRFYAQFFVNNPLIGSLTSSPYAMNWFPTMTGPYTITAFASDSLGNSQFSLPIAVTVYLDANGDGVPDVWEVQNGNDPMNPWLPPVANTNDHTAPIITLLIPTNAVIVP